jgi:simple sugar transport system ATP-binding protein
MSASVPILEMKGIRKVFAGAVALDGVDFRLFPGEVHAVMGQNGAGKSTLVKTLTGVYKQEAGSIFLAGKPIRPDSPLAARKLGISTVYQEVNLCLNLSVAENIMIGKEPTVAGTIDWKSLRRMATTALARLDLDIDVNQPLATYSIAVQQMVAIARALDETAKILILDEPTSSLDENEVERLFGVIAKLRAEGLAVLFITHFIDQVYRIADRITILKDGRLVGEYLAGDLPKIELVTKMLGKELSSFSRGGKAESPMEKALRKLGDGAAKPAAASAPPAAKPAAGKPAAAARSALKVANIGRRGSIAPCGFDLAAGEILGLAGLLGSGRSELARLIFGIDQAETGDIEIGGEATAINAPRDAMLAGIGFCSEDRKNEAVFADLSVRENIILALQAKRGVFKAIPRKQAEALAAEAIASLKIKTAGAGSPIGSLSGGNQQKAMLARWLATDPSVFILDEPTRGIDVGAKLEIMERILDLSAAGLGVVFISSEFDEVIRCSHKIAVLKDKAMIAELSGGAMTEHDILKTIAEGA